MDHVDHDKRHVVQTSLPTHIYALDLQKLSKMIGCLENELIQGLGTDSHAMESVVVSTEDEISFESLHISEEEHQPTLVGIADPPKVTQVLLTLASRPGALDRLDLPKCLIEIGGRTIVSLILSHLYTSGMQRVVISVAHCGAQIIQAVLNHPVAPLLDIEFLDLGPDNRDGHARSVLAAKACFSSPFLIHTGDHIFDDTLLRELARVDLGNSSSACVLVECDLAHFEPQRRNLPLTNIKVHLDTDSGMVLSIGRTLEGCHQEVHGIEAGLFLVSPVLFNVLEEKCTISQVYFSLADALEIFAQAGALTYLPTNGKSWYSIETEEELAYVDQAGEVSPWTVYCTLPRAGARVLTSPVKQNNLVFAFSEERSTTFHVAKTTTQKQNILNGFIVGVGHVDAPHEDDRASEGESTPLLPFSYPHASTRARHKSLSWNTKTTDESEERKMWSQSSPDIQPFRDQSGIPMVVSFPIPEPTTKHEHTHEAYLIEFEDKNQTYFTMPEQPELARASSFFDQALTLPSDISQVHIETVGFNMDIQVVIERKVPVIGFTLLIISLVSLSSLGPALDLESSVSPISKFFWRISGTSFALFPIAMYYIAKEGWPRLSLHQGVALVIASVAYSGFSGFYILALDMTSISDATLFSNTHSLVIVVGRKLTGQSISTLEGVGTFIGLLGSIICGFDSTPASVIASSSIKPSNDLSIVGDLIAFVGAICGAVYLQFSKFFRSTNLNVYIFMWIITSLGSLVGLCGFVIFDPASLTREGLFGWLNVQPGTQLPVELYIIFVVNLVGTVGYINVMKYFDPIVISVVMLAEPLISTLMGVVIGVSPLPGIWTYVGGSIVILGSSVVMFGSKSSTESIQITDTPVIKRKI